jgi:hypothetical protein
MNRLINAVILTLCVALLMVYCTDTRAAGVYTVGAANRDLTDTPATSNLATGYVMAVVQTEFMSDPLVCKQNFESQEAFAAESRQVATVILDQLQGPTSEANKAQIVMYVIRDAMRRAYPCK